MGLSLVVPHGKTIKKEKSMSGTSGFHNDPKRKFVTENFGQVKHDFSASNKAKSDLDTTLIRSLESADEESLAAILQDLNLEEIQIIEQELLSQINKKQIVNAILDRKVCLSAEAALKDKSPPVVELTDLKVSLAEYKSTHSLFAILNKSFQSLQKVLVQRLNKMSFQDVEDFLSALGSNLVFLNLTDILESVEEGKMRDFLRRRINEHRGKPVNRIALDQLKGLENSFSKDDQAKVKYEARILSAIISGLKVSEIIFKNPERIKARQIKELNEHLKKAEKTAKQAISWSSRFLRGFEQTRGFLGRPLRFWNKICRVRKRGQFDRAKVLAALNTGKAVSIADMVDDGKKDYKAFSSGKKEDVILALTVSDTVVENTRPSRYMYHSISRSVSPEKRKDLNDYIRENLPQKDFFWRENAFQSGGNAFVMTENEEKVIDKILEQDTLSRISQKVSKRLTPEEREKISNYQADLKRSKDLNLAISSLRNVQKIKDQLKDLTSEEQINKKNEELKKIESEKLNRLSLKLLQDLEKLEVGQGIILDMSIEDHDMRLVIRKTRHGYSLTNYDSSGVIERSNMGSTLLGGLQLYMLEGKDRDQIAPRGNAMQILVNDIQMFSKGQEYFKKLLFLGTYYGAKHQQELMLKDNLKEKIKDKIAEWILPNFSDEGYSASRLRRRQIVYLNFIDKFSQIAEQGRPPKILPYKQSPQITKNCYAKRIETCMLYEMGIRPFKILWQAIYQQQREELLEIAIGKSGDIESEKDAAIQDESLRLELKKQSQGVKTPSELMRISEGLLHLHKAPKGSDLKVYWKNLRQEITKIKKELSTENKNLKKETDPNKKNETLKKINGLKTFIEGLEAKQRELSFLHIDRMIREGLNKEDFNDKFSQKSRVTSFTEAQKERQQRLRILDKKLLLKLLEENPHPDKQTQKKIMQSINSYRPENGGEESLQDENYSQEIKNEIKVKIEVLETLLESWGNYSASGESGGVRQKFQKASKTSYKGEQPPFFDDYGRKIISLINKLINDEDSALKQEDLDEVRAYYLALKEFFLAFDKQNISKLYLQVFESLLPALDEKLAFSSLSRAKTLNLPDPAIKRFTQRELVYEYQNQQNLLQIPSKNYALHKLYDLRSSEVFYNSLEQVREVTENKSLDEDNNFFETLTHECYKAILELLGHASKKLDTERRYLTKEDDRLLSVSYGDLMKKCKDVGNQAVQEKVLKALENMTVVSYIVGIKRIKQFRLEIELDGQLREITTSTFLKLLEKFPQALTLSKVNEILQFLRTESPSHKKEIDKKVSPLQLVTLGKDGQKHLQKLDQNLKKLKEDSGNEKTKNDDLQDRLREQISQQDKIIKDNPPDDLGEKSLLHEEAQARKEFLEAIVLSKSSSSSKSESRKIDSLIAYSASLTIEQHKYDELTKTLKRPSLFFMKLAENPYSIEGKVIEEAYLRQDEVKKIEAEIQEVKETKEIAKKELFHNCYQKYETYKKQLLKNELRKHPKWHLLLQMAEQDYRSSKAQQKKMTQSSLSTQIQELNKVLFERVSQAFEEKLDKLRHNEESSRTEKLDNEEFNIDEEIGFLIKATENESVKSVFDKAFNSDFDRLWLESMGKLWLEHEDPVWLLETSQIKNEHEIKVLFEKRFQEWIESHTNYKALNFSSQELQLNFDDIGISQIFPGQGALNRLKELVDKNASMIQRAFRKKREKHWVEDSVEKQKIESVKQCDLEKKSHEFSGVTAEFDTFMSQGGVHGSSLAFLRETKLDVEFPISETQAEKYQADASLFLKALNANMGLENRSERIIEACHEISLNLFKMADKHLAGSTLVTLIQDLLIQELDPNLSHIKLDQDFSPIEKTLLRIDNKKRSLLLKSMLYSAFSTVDKVGGKRRLRADFVSLAKQWERLIFPKDPVLFEICENLEADSGIHSPDVKVMKNLGTLRDAIFHSEVALEAIDEGQMALDDSLYFLGVTKGGVDRELRKRADLLSSRQEKALLVSGFLQYYKDVLSFSHADGVNSSQGRETFSRAFLEAYQVASKVEKESLNTFIRDLIEKKQEMLSNDGSLRIPLKIFLLELLDEANLGANEAVLIESEKNDINTFTDSLINAGETQGELRLLGFCRKMYQVKKELKKIDKDNIASRNTLLSNLICYKLQYQSLLETVPDEVLESFDESFEFRREMAHASLIENQDEIYLFLSQIEKKEVSNALLETLKNLQKESPIEALKDVVLTVKTSDIRGFLQIGSNKRWDVLHGVVYTGENKASQLSKNIREHPDVKLLAVDKLPYEKKGSSFIYAEDGTPSVCLKEVLEGDVLIQRRLKSLDQTSQMLQYLPDDYSKLIPSSIRNRLGIEQFYLDEAGGIHGFDEKYQAVCILKKNNKDDWHLTLLDEEGEKRTYLLKGNTSDLLYIKLKKLVGDEEILSFPKGEGYFIPALGMSVSKPKGIWLIAGGIYHNKEIEQGNEKEGFFLKNHLSLDQKKDLEQKKQEYEVIQNQIHEQTEKSLSLRELKNIKLLNQQLEEKAKEIGELEGRTLLVLSQSKLEKLKSEKKAEIEALDCEIGKLPSQEMSVEERKVTLFNLRQQLLKIKQELKHYDKNPLELFSLKVDYFSHLSPYSFNGLLQLALNIQAEYPTLIEFFRVWQSKQILDEEELESLLDLDTVLALKAEGSKDLDLLNLRLLLNFSYLKHTISTRQACCEAKQITWDRSGYELAKKNISRIIDSQIELGQTKADKMFQEDWIFLHAELSEPKYEGFFQKKASSASPLGLQQLNFIESTQNSPVDQLNIQSDFTYTVKNPATIVDESQDKLIRNLRASSKNQAAKASIEDQERGFYFENGGFFDLNGLSNFLRIQKDEKGAFGLTKSNLQDLFTLFQEEKWIKKTELSTQELFQLTDHPEKFFSKNILEAKLKELGFTSKDINPLIRKFESFFLLCAQNGIDYDFPREKVNSIKEKVSKLLYDKQTHFLEAERFIMEFMDQFKGDLDFADLKFAYLSDDYRSFQDVLVSKGLDPSAIKKMLWRVRNAFTRQLYFQSEIDHLSNTNAELGKGNYRKAAHMLFMRRNYSLDVLLKDYSSTSMSEEAKNKLFEEQMLTRAFLLFEVDFHNRCNIQQVEVFRGLLLSNELDPESIDAAQARMGFGKTSLLPLIALVLSLRGYLIRYIVPKSALETNSSDISLALSRILGKRAIKDDFKRYKIAPDKPGEKGEESSRYQSLVLAKEDLKYRLNLYTEVNKNHYVLVQAPHVRNALENQAKIFLDLLSKTTQEDQKRVIYDCICLLNKIRSIKTFSIFDELDATQDLLSTDVNFTTGEKLSLNPDHIKPLETLLECYEKFPGISNEKLLEKVLQSLGVQTDNEELNAYLLSANKPPPAVELSDNLLLLRAFFSDEKMMTLLKEKEANKDFGIWYQMGAKGKREYDYQATNPNLTFPLKPPFLVAVPYASANEPKAKGSRFDNPEVTILATLMTLRDLKTPIEEDPHLEFLIDAFREGGIEEQFVIAGKDDTFLEEVRKVAMIEDKIVRAEARAALFNKILSDPLQFRIVLSRVVLIKQLEFDKGKARSDRYEQGTINDRLKGFSGTSSDTSSFFKKVLPDPAADGNMTIGIMGRESNQECHVFNLTDKGLNSKAYTEKYLEKLQMSMNEKTRVIVDVGGQCRCSNKEVAEILFKTLVKEKKSKVSKDLKGVIFYDDATNTKKLMREDSQEALGYKVVNLSKNMEKESDLYGQYFTFFDEAHSRGADIPQMNGAHALLTVGMGLINNNYKQAIMRMRKIIDPSLKQSFSICILDHVKSKINSQLQKEESADITGNDIALWLRNKELDEGQENTPSLARREVRALVGNLIMQKQADASNCLNQTNPSDKEQEAFNKLIEKLNKIQSFISKNSFDLFEKYGRSLEQIDKTIFLKKIEVEFKDALTAIKSSLDDFSQDLNISVGISISEKEEQFYEKMYQTIIEKRVDPLPDRFELKSLDDAFADGHVEAQNDAQDEAQSESQSEVEAQSYSFSQAQADKIEKKEALTLASISYKRASLDFLNSVPLLTIAGAYKAYAYLLNDIDQVKISPQLREKMNKKENQTPGFPSLKYMLYNPDEKETFILISKEEAALFKNQAATYPQYLLLDINTLQDDNFHYLAYGANKSIEGVRDQLLSNPTIKRLMFYSFQHNLDVTSLSEIPEKSENLVPAEDLQPIFKKQEDSIFILSEWGYGGLESIDVDFSLDSAKDEYLKLTMLDETLQLEEIVYKRAKEKIVNGEKEVISTIDKEMQKEKEDLKAKKTEAKRTIEKEKEILTRALEHQTQIEDKLKADEQALLNKAKEDFYKNYKTRTLQRVFDLKAGQKLDFSSEISTLEDQNKIQETIATKKPNFTDTFLKTKITKELPKYILSNSKIFSLKESEKKNLGRCKTPYEAYKILWELCNENGLNFDDHWNEFFERHIYLNKGNQSFYQAFIEKAKANFKECAFNTTRPTLFKTDGKLDNFLDLDVKSLLNEMFKDLVEEGGDTNTFFKRVIFHSFTDTLDKNLTEMNNKPPKNGKTDTLDKKLKQRDDKSSKNDKKWVLTGQTEDIWTNVKKKLKGKIRLNLSLLSLEFKKGKEEEELEAYIEKLANNIIKRLENPQFASEKELEKEKTKLKTLFSQKYEAQKEIATNEEKIKKLQAFQAKKTEIEALTNLQDPLELNKVLERLNDILDKNKIELLQELNLKYFYGFGHFIKNYALPKLIDDDQPKRSNQESIQVGTENIELKDIEGSFEIISNLDKAYYAIDQKLEQVKLAKQKHKNTYEKRVEQSLENLKQFRIQFPQLEKDHSKVKKFIGSQEVLYKKLKDKKIMLSDKAKKDLLEAFFDLNQLLDKDTSGLEERFQLIPPKFYSLHSDLNEECISRHGLVEKEKLVSDSLEKVYKQVQSQAQIVKKRQIKSL